MLADLRYGVFPAAEADLQPKRTRWQYAGKQQTRQRQVQQPLLPGTQPMPAGPPVQPVRRRLYRPNADLSAGARSVFSHVNVPFASSGWRPK